MLIAKKKLISYSSRLEEEVNLKLKNLKMIISIKRLLLEKTLTLK